MPIYELEGVAPRIDADAFVHPDAVVIGDVVIGADSSVWPGAVLRGDYGTITVGSGSSIQDGTVVHAGPGFPTTIGDGCVVGHLTHLEGCTLEDQLPGGLRECRAPLGRHRHGGDGWCERRRAQSHGDPTGRTRPGRAGKDLRGSIGCADDPGLGRRIRGERQALPGFAASHGLSRRS